MKVLPAGLVLLLALAGCGARGDDAGELTAEIVERINAGSCDDGTDWLAAADWTTLCGGVRDALAPGGTLTAGPTTTRQSGEIGYSYASDVTFTDALPGQAGASGLPPCRGGGETGAAP